MSRLVLSSFAFSKLTVTDCTNPLMSTLTVLTWLPK